MACVSCRLELCYSCYEPKEDDCCCGGDFGEDSFEDIFGEGEPVKKKKKKEPEEPVVKNPVGRPRLPPEELKNALRAGRYRAARLVGPIPPGTICQWKGLKFAGGGIRPIIGCVGRPAGARHHGPDKSTNDNEVGTNLHLICHQCHNRWHARNDEFYGERPADGSAYVPRDDAGKNHFHDPNSTATTAEQAEWELYWQTPKAKRVLETHVIVEEEEEPEIDEETAS
jgi:hypothetical protein